MIRITLVVLDDISSVSHLRPYSLLPSYVLTLAYNDQLFFKYSSIFVRFSSRVP
jgi:hypothetical protein